MKLIILPTVSDEGMLTFAQYPKIPFQIKRIYYIYDCKPGISRGAHAHYETKQILFCLRGSVEISIDNGKEKESIILNNPHTGIFLDKLVWHDMTKIKRNTFMLVLASKTYDSKDYIRDYNKFIKEVSNV